MLFMRELNKGACEGRQVPIDTAQNVVAKVNLTVDLRIYERNNSPQINNPFKA